MKKQQIVIISVLCGLFVAGAVLAITGVLENFEGEIADFINHGRNKNIIMRFFTELGEWYGVVGVTALLMLIPATRRRIGAPIAVTVTSSWLICTMIKNIVRRARPELKVIPQGGYSFPSGHATNNMALYLGIMLLALHICKTRTQKAWVIFICSAFAFIIGFSRIYFNVHFTSDVISGWCLGAVIAIVGTQIYFNIENKKAGKLTNDRGQN